MNHHLQQQIEEAMRKADDLPAGAVDLQALKDADSRRLRRVPIFAGIVFQMLAHTDLGYTFPDGFPEGTTLRGIQIEATKQGPQFVLVVHNPAWAAIMPGTPLPYHLLTIRSFAAPPAEDDPPAAGEGVTSPSPAPGQDEGEAD